MDRSNSVTNNSRLVQSSQTAYEKLTLRLTPKVIDSRSIIRIPTKTTFTNSVLTDTSSLNYKTDWIDITSPKRHSANSPILQIPSSPPVIDQAEQTITDSQVTKSYLSSSTTHDWERECKALRETIESQKNRITQLESKNMRFQQELSESLTKIELVQGPNFKEKLQQTQQRMGQQNAYLRDCMFKLHQQLESIKIQTVQKLQRQINILQEQNSHFIHEIRSKNNQLNQKEQKYSNISNLYQQQKISIQKIKEQYNTYQQKMKVLQLENKNLTSEIELYKQNNKTLLGKIMQQQEHKKELINDNSSIKRAMENHKQIAQQLKSSMKKLRQQNLSLNKSIQSSITPKNNTLFKLNNQRPTLSKLSSKNRLLSRIPSMNNVCNQEQQLGFDTSVYINRSQQFQSLRQSFEIKGQVNIQYFTILLSLAQYFHEGLEKMLNDRMKDKQIIEKYKKLLEVTIHNPKSELKTSQFITELIQKCNLLQSSVQEKKSTINRLTQEVDKMRIDGQAKSARHYKSQEYQIEKSMLSQKGQTKIDTNPSFTSPNQSYHRESTKGLVGILQRCKYFKPANYIQSRQNNHYLRYKNTPDETHIESENHREEYLKKCDSILEESDHLKDYVQQSIKMPRQSQDLSKNQRLWSQSVQKRRERVVGSSQPFEQSKLHKPGTADLGPKKKRLDQLIKNQLSKKTVLALILRLSQIAMNMSKNCNFVSILPDSVYILNYSEDNLKSLKLKVLETTKNISQIKKYWAPQNINGEPFNQSSLVWNIGVIFQQYLQNAKKNSLNSSSVQQKLSFLNEMQKLMLQSSPQKRIKLKSIQQMILNHDKNLLN